MTIYVNGFSVVSSLGMTPEDTVNSLTSAAPPRAGKTFQLLNGGTTLVAELSGDLGKVNGRTRTNQILSRLVQDIRPQLDDAIARYGAGRIAGVIGTSTSGIGEAEAPLRQRVAGGDWPEDYRFEDQELGDTADFLAAEAGIGGVCYSVSTACTSGAKAFASAARLINSGLADAVICGGVDSLASLTVNGFAALDSVSPEPANPMSVNRRGINIGEGGALFIVSKEPGPYRILSAGETSDAYHMSSPDPTGQTAEKAIRTALDRAGLQTTDIDFIHLHGTATPLNDQMESTLMHRMFGEEVPCASTKGMTGHTLGAAGAVQAAINFLSMESGFLPPHVYDGERDPDLPMIRLAGLQEKAAKPVDHVLSASYAFGGSNVAVIMARG